MTTIEKKAMTDIMTKTLDQMCEQYGFKLVVLITMPKEADGDFMDWWCWSQDPNTLNFIKKFTGYAYHPITHLFEEMTNGRLPKTLKVPGAIPKSDGGKPDEGSSGDN